MKELSIEEKAQRYDEIINVARLKIKNDKDHVLYENDIIEIFPELIENESEKIRKALLKFVHDTPGDDLWIDYDVHKEDVLAWLEKQGELDDNIITRDDEILQAISVGLTDIVEDIGWSDFGGIPIEEIQDWLEKKPAKNIVEIWKDMRLEVYQQASGNRHEPNYSDDTTKMFSLNDIDEIIEKISEQKSADKVNPKFHEGEWIVYQGTYNVCQVIAIINGLYELKYGDSYAVQKCADVDRCARLWNIGKDAKDGDVLQYINDNDNRCCIFKKIDPCDNHFYAYCGIDNTGDFIPNSKDWWGYSDRYVPASKEQRDILFTKMKEAGYKWDSEKKVLYQDLKKLQEKELKKIEQKTTEWSEEDETNLHGIVAEIMANKNEAPSFDTKVYNGYLNWLVSIKCRMQ